MATNGLNLNDLKKAMDGSQHLFDAAILIADVMNSAEVGNYLSSSDYLGFLEEYKETAGNVTRHVTRTVAGTLRSMARLRFPSLDGKLRDDLIGHMDRVARDYLQECFYRRIVGDEIVVVATKPVTTMPLVECNGTALWAEDLFCLPALLMMVTRVARNLKISWSLSSFNQARLRERKGIVEVGIGIEVGKIQLKQEVRVLDSEDESPNPLGTRKHPEGFALTMAKRVEQATRLGQHSHIMMGETAYYTANLHPSLPVDWADAAMPSAKGISQEFKVFEVRSFVGYIYWDCAEIAHPSRLPPGKGGDDSDDAGAALFAEVADIYRERTFPPWLGLEVGTMYMYRGEFDEAERILASQVRVSPSTRSRIALAETLINTALRSADDTQRTACMENALSLFRELSNKEGKYFKEQGILLDGNLFYLKRENPFGKLKTYAKYIRDNLGWRNCAFGDVRSLFWSTYLVVLAHDFVRDFLVNGVGFSLADLGNTRLFTEGGGTSKDKVTQALLRFAPCREAQVAEYSRTVFDLYHESFLRSRSESIFKHHGLELKNLDRLDRRIRMYDLRFANENYNVNILQCGAMFFGLLLPLILKPPEADGLAQCLHDRSVTYVKQVLERLPKRRRSLVYYSNLQPFFPEPLAEGEGGEKVRGLLQLVSVPTMTNAMSVFHGFLRSGAPPKLHPLWRQDRPSG
jgi:class 3 adenylate cyclase